jgi:hypothetical protein
MAITQREFCTVEKDGHLTIVTINRPDVMNSTHHEVDLELDQGGTSSQRTPSSGSASSPARATARSAPATT